MGTLWAKVSNHLQRALYLLSLASFALPFVTVKGCQSEKITEYAGYELLGEDGGWLYVIPIGLGVLFLALSFLRQPGNVIARGFVSSMKALLAFASGYVVGLFPYLQFVADAVHARTGQYVASVSWALVYATGLGSTLIAVHKTSLAQHAAGAGLSRPIRFIFWVQVAVIVSLLAVSVATSILWKDGRYFVLLVAVFALSLYFALPFAERGLAEQWRWAVTWVVATTLLLGAAVVLSVLLTAPFVFFVIPVVATIVGLAGLAGGYFSPWGGRSH